MKKPSVTEVTVLPQSKKVRLQLSSSKCQAQSNMNTNYRPEIFSNPCPDLFCLQPSCFSRPAQVFSISGFRRGRGRPTSASGLSFRNSSGPLCSSPVWSTPNFSPSSASPWRPSTPISISGHFASVSRPLLRPILSMKDSFKMLAFL